MLQIIILDCLNLARQLNLRSKVVHSIVLFFKEVSLLSVTKFPLCSKHETGGNGFPNFALCEDMKK
ncbi:hypothetical protein T05_11260 [Trichinella murrelli]|uniref:Uncharacterized protein n=1 Tax=Trichinella murrelli TaxID=144512 RepID=A0A0V0TMJ3_9BILA|nr:hypothetical protein T05_11260 [Trichinella murrelli]